MKTYKINKTFNNIQEMTKWEEENCKNRVYNNENILMINKQSICGSNKITIIDIETI